MLTFKVAADHFAMPLAERWGVRPLINAGGVRTKYGGSFILPEVVAEMATLEGVFVDMSVLAAAAGKALRELTGAEWGMVTGGSAAGLTLATAACLVGDDPLARFQLPGAARGQIVAVPRGHLSLYDSAILAAGAELREVERVHELEAIGDRLAMIFFVGLREPDGAIGFDALAASAARLGVPILVDAASELLALPERWTRRGADLVVYSGGKRLGGPAGTGLLLGREDLVKAAGLHGDP
ncbi:MAG: aminotransferase class V-fold PLP-dependent enzyme, partial [Alphaproteobacteria bacterium]|nr:aminotransferase class V-fold PLP-dependent enzyme [Alphaproteobacteria bacterium]